MNGGYSKKKAGLENPAGCVMRKNLCQSLVSGKSHSVGVMRWFGVCNEINWFASGGLGLFKFGLGFLHQAAILRDWLLGKMGVLCCTTV